MTTDSSPKVDQLTGHEDESDGIQEYDNRSPFWLTAIFVGSVLWSFGYFLHYHVFADRSQAGAYEEEVAALQVAAPEAPADEGYSESPEAIAAGKSIYGTSCQACHGATLDGAIGPSLVDDEWLYGSSPEEVAKVISEGKVANQMPAWAGILGPQKVNQVTAYILSEGK